MVNMGNVKFENTYLALRECIEHIEDCKATGESEREYADSLREACVEYLEAYGCNGVRSSDDD